MKSDFARTDYEIAVSGKDAVEKLEEINQVYIPNKLIAGSIGESNIPLMEGRYNDDVTFVYICVDGACKLPESDVKKALEQLNKYF